MGSVTVVQLATLLKSATLSEDANAMAQALIKQIQRDIATSKRIARARVSATPKDAPEVGLPSAPDSFARLANYVAGLQSVTENDMRQLDNFGLRGSSKKMLLHLTRNEMNRLNMRIGNGGVTLVSKFASCKVPTGKDVFYKQNEKEDEYPLLVVDESPGYLQQKLMCYPESVRYSVVLAVRNGHYLLAKNLVELSSFDALAGLWKFDQLKLALLCRYQAEAISVLVSDGANESRVHELHEFVHTVLSRMKNSKCDKIIAKEMETKKEILLNAGHCTHCAYQAAAMHLMKRCMLFLIANTASKELAELLVQYMIKQDLQTGRAEIKNALEQGGGDMISRMNWKKMTDNGKKQIMYEYLDQMTQIK